MEQRLLGWAGNILNVLVFIILLMGTKKECIDSNTLISSVIMIGISFLIQLIDTLGGQSE